MRTFSIEFSWVSARSGRLIRSCTIWISCLEFAESVKTQPTFKALTPRFQGISVALSYFLRIPAWNYSWKSNLILEKSTTSSCDVRTLKSLTTRLSCPFKSQCRITRILRQSMKVYRTPSLRPSKLQPRSRSDTQFWVRSLRTRKEHSRNYTLQCKHDRVNCWIVKVWFMFASHSRMQSMRMRNSHSDAKSMRFALIVLLKRVKQREILSEFLESPSKHSPPLHCLSQDSVFRSTSRTQAFHFKSFLMLTYQQNSKKESRIRSPTIQLQLIAVVSLNRW